MEATDKGLAYQSVDREVCRKREVLTKLDVVSCTSVEEIGRRMREKTSCHWYGRARDVYRAAKETMHGCCWMNFVGLQHNI
jgi:hypothetical protein